MLNASWKLTHLEIKSRISLLSRSSLFTTWSKFKNNWGKSSHFSNFIALHRISCVSHVTSHDCGLSFSAMWVLKTRTWKLMLTKRLTTLAIMNILQNHPVNYTEVAKMFFIIYPRKKNRNNLFFFSEGKLPNGKPISKNTFK